MNRLALYTVAAATIAVSAAGRASAQSANSFLNADHLSGLSLTQEDAKTFRLEVTGSPTMSYLGVTYHINSVFGLWAISSTESDFAETSDTGVWDDTENFAGAGGIVGWKTNPNSGLEAGEQKTFQFDRLSSNDVARYGFHIRVNETLPSGGNTAYFTRSIPAPGSLAMLGLGGLVVPRRRR